MSLPPPAPPPPPLPPTFDIAREFPIAARWTFLNHAAVAPLAARAAEALRTYAAQAEQDAYLTGRWYKQAELTRRRCAQLIHADPDEIAFCKNTSEGLAFVANGLTWHPGDQILSTAVEYPANVYPWMDLARRKGIVHTMVPERDGRIPPEDLFAAVTPRTRLITLSHVEYASGFRHDLAAIGAFCHSRGILLCVDAIQSAGVLPIDVRAMHIDFLSADGHKWLLAPEGAGFFFCARRHLADLHPEIGWLNVVNALDYAHYDLTLRPDARRFECGSYNIPGVLALGAALELILEVGVDLIAARVLALTDQLCAGLARKGYPIFSSRPPLQSGTRGEASGIVSFTPPAHDPAALLKALEGQKIILALRENRLRASPHFYNTPEQIDRLLAALP